MHQATKLLNEAADKRGSWLASTHGRSAHQQREIKFKGKSSQPPAVKPARTQPKLQFSCSICDVCDLLGGWVARPRHLSAHVHQPVKGHNQGSVEGALQSTLFRASSKRVVWSWKMDIRVILGSFCALARAVKSQDGHDASRAGMDGQALDFV